MRRTVLLLTFALSSPRLAAAAEPPASPQLAAFESARERLGSGDAAGAIAALEPFAKAGAAEPPTRALLAAAYLELGRAAEAAAVLAPVADGPQAKPPLLFQAARAAAALGDQAKADAYLARAAAQDPASLGARTLGLRRAEQGDAVDACQLLQPYARAHAEDHEARLGAAFCSLLLDQREVAAAMLQDLPSDDPRARLLRGRLALVRGLPYDAIAQLEPLAATPTPAVEHELQRTLAEAYIEVGKAQEAITLLARKVAGDAELSLLLARAQQQAGEPAAAVATVAPFAAQLTAAAPPPGLPASVGAGLALEWGRALLALRQWSEAVVALQAATRFEPANRPAWQALIQALRGAGRRDEAEAAATRLRALVAPAAS